MNFNQAANLNFHTANRYLWRSFSGLILIAVFCTILLAYHRRIILLNFHTNFGAIEKITTIHFQTAILEENLTSITTKKPKIFNKSYIILMWTPIFGQYPNFSESFQGCPELNCKITSDKSQTSKATAFIYHMIDFDWNYLPPKWTTDQYHVFLLHESPIYTYIDLKKRPNYCRSSKTSTYSTVFLVKVGLKLKIAKIEAYSETFKAVVRSEIIFLFSIDAFCNHFQPIKY